MHGGERGSGEGGREGGRGEEHAKEREGEGWRRITELALPRADLLTRGCWHQVIVFNTIVIAADDVYSERTKDSWVQSISVISDWVPPYPHPACPKTHGDEPPA